MARRGHRIVRVSSVETGQTQDQPGEGRRRLDNQDGQRIAAASRLDVPLAQVQQVASRLHFDGAPEIGGVDGELVERVRPGDDGVIGKDGAELERKGVKRALELVAGENERCRESPLVPRLHALRAGTKIVAAERLHDGHGLDRLALAIEMASAMMGFTVALARRAHQLAVHDERQQAAAEDLAELALEPLDCRLHGLSLYGARPRRRRNAFAGLPPYYNGVPMRLHEINVGCFGGGTGLPSLLGGLKHNPWLRVNAVVTMFDSGGSSGQLRDELGVLPPGDILKCALALARNAREARRVLLARLPTLEHARLGGHTGGNLLLSMMQRYSGDFLDAVEGLRQLLGCRGRVWPVSVQHASVCAEYGDGSATRGEVEVDAGQSSGQFVRRIWLEPPVSIHPTVAKAISEFDAAIIGPGSFYTSLMPIFLVRGVADAMKEMKGPIVLIANLLTEGRGMIGFTAADAVARIEEAIRRHVDVVVVNNKWPTPAVLNRYALEHKEPLQAGDLPRHCEVIGGDFWAGDIARHDRPRLAYAVWSILSKRLLCDA